MHRLPDDDPARRAAEPVVEKAMTPAFSEFRMPWKTSAPVRDQAQTERAPISQMLSESAKAPFQNSS